MHVSVVSTLPSSAVRPKVGPLAWMPDALRALGHDVHVVDRPGLVPDSAADLGYHLADSWASDAPDVVVALGWLAGLAAQVATRERKVPVLLRLPRPGRSGDPSVSRVERALARSGVTLLAASPSEAEVLSTLGAPRARVRVLPEALDVAALRPRPAGAGEDIVLAVDDSPEDVALVLAGMAAGRPAVVLDQGTLGDLVADGVSGIVASSRSELMIAARALRADPMRREAMGMAAADRVDACFDTAVVGPVLGRLLDEAGRGALSRI